MLAGLTGTDAGTPWDILRYQYRRGGIGGWFDIAALHLYTGKAENVVDGVRLFRRVMKRNGDRRKPVWMTEFGITASKGRTNAPPAQRTLRTTDRGMAAFLAGRLPQPARRKERKLRLQRAYWYTWASSYKEGAGIFRFTGLNQYVDGRLDPKPALASTAPARGGTGRTSRSGGRRAHASPRLSARSRVFATSLTWPVPALERVAAGAGESKAIAGRPPRRK